MVSATVIIRKRQPQYMYVVKAEDWLNPGLYVIDGQEVYSGDTNTIIKAEYKVGWVIDENGEVNYPF